MTETPPLARPFATRRQFLGAVGAGVSALGANGLMAAWAGGGPAFAQPGVGQPGVGQPGVGPNAATAFPDGVHLTVAGPEGGELDDWSRILVPALAGFLPASTPLRRGLAGGVDGVTGANQFAAQALPDGAAALLAPGQAVLGWLRGDQAVQFDIARWSLLLGGLCDSVIVSRLTPAQLVPGQKLRIGVGGPNGPEFAAMLGFERLGLQPVPVGGVVDRLAAEAAFGQHAVDVLLLRGPAIAAILAGTDARPICVLGVPDASGALTRDPNWPELPHLGELLGGLPPGHLTMAWRATAVAAQLSFVLMLPKLTQATLVTIWRRAIEQASATAEVQAMVTAQATRLLTQPDAVAGMLMDPNAIAALRGWVAERQRR